MTSPENRQLRLEHLMQRALCELPPRRAPASLERRVIEAIEKRAGRGSRPLAVSAALLACCLASVIGVLLGLKELAIELALLPADPSIAGRLQTLRDAGRAAAALGALVLRLVRMIPPAWLVGALLATAALYAVLFGLIAIGYSTLYGTPQRSRS
ncbi:MAG: hypothetical protein ACREUT_06340 [Steroidobacteraceae bacterium]